MKQKVSMSALRCLFSVISLTLALQGCGGGSSPEAASAVVITPTAAPVKAALLSLVVPAVTARCPAGGTTIASGLDSNGNGVLEEGEITSRQDVCNGSNGVNGVNGTNGAAGVNGVDGTNGANGSNGLTGVWPSEWLSDKRSYYYLTLALVVASLVAMRRMLYAPFGYSLRAARDSVLRSDAIGMNVRHLQWAAFVIAGTFAGLAGALYAFSKGSISPESLHVSKSVDGLVMVLLGGVQTLLGPVVGAVTFTWLHDTVARNTDYWRAMLGGIILMLVLLFPQGIAGFVNQRIDWLQRRRKASA